MMLESTIKKNIANIKNKGVFILLTKSKSFGDNKDTPKYNNAAIFATLKLEIIGENTSKFKDAKNRQAKKNWIC